MPAFELLPLGDCALLLRPLHENGPDVLFQTRAKIVAAALPGITEIVTGYESLTVFGEVAVLESTKSQIADLLVSVRQSEPAIAATNTIEIPVCYDVEFALDLERVAEHSGLPAEEVIRLHAGGEYTVRCVGFTPGFPYLSGLPAALATPRRATPRTKVPAGSVAIGGPQTGIYPTASPGGWNVIGRTPLHLFDPQRQSPALLQAGDRIRVRSITRDEFLSG